MQITYQEIDATILEKIAAKYGQVAKDHIYTEEGSYSLAAICGESVVGFISTYTQNLAAPIGEDKDAYIDIIEVDPDYRRMGIAAQLVLRTEEWAKKAGLLQIRAWSSHDKAAAIPMWRSLGYGLCPAKIWIEWCKEAVDGYYVVKQLNPVNPYPNITKLIKEELRDVSAKPIRNFRLISANSGVYVYRCLYDGEPAVVKYFEKDDDRREILNYQILTRHDIPTIKPLALGTATLVMEDISASEDWRLGVEEDQNDTDVTRSLAQWYFKFHEKGATVPELDTLYFEFDGITEENLTMLLEKFPEAQELLKFLLTHLDKLRELICQPSFTLTYNDFHWSNFVVRKDKRAAMMFDYNLLGKGYRLSDFRNVCWSMSDEAKAAFVDEYNRLYFEKHGQGRGDEEKFEERIDGVAADVFSLIFAFLRFDHNIPDWAKELKSGFVDGSLLAKAKELLL